MTKYTTVLANLLSPLSRSAFENAVQSRGGDKWAGEMKTWDFFKSMVYGQIADCFSVREIEKSMLANSSRLYHAGLKPIKRSTFCDAMQKRDHHIFQTVFHSIVDLAQMIAGNTKKQFQNPLRIIDSTIISLCLSMCEWASYRSRKGAVKIHMNLDGDNLLPFDAHLTTGKVHDINALHWLCQESDVIYVMDRGYVDYKSLYNIDMHGSTFVTRMKSNGKYKRIKNNPPEKDGSILSDATIQFTGPVAKNSYPDPLRKIRYYDGERKKTYEFITNNFELTAQQIADIYKERWQVELFFKWLKQNLKIKTFWGTSENAVFTQIWVALIISVLLWICKTLDGITVSVHQMLQMMKTTLLLKKSITGLFVVSSPHPKIHSSQLVLEGIYDSTGKQKNKTGKYKSEAGREK